MKDNLIVLDESIVPVYQTSTGEQVVYGTELHSTLKSKSDFSTWIKRRLSECDAMENIDFTRLPKKVEANNATMIEYIIKLDTAKEMAMLERNDIGKKVRKHFIEIEKKYKRSSVPLTVPEQIVLLAQGHVELSQRVDTVETKVFELENTMNLDYSQQNVLGEAVNKTVLSVLGGKSSNAYRSIGKKVFAECNHDLKAFFKVNARANVPKKRFEEALKYAENWKPCTNTVMMISNANAQENFVF